MINNLSTFFASIAADFRMYLLSIGISELTLKNYLSDYRHFVYWAIQIDQSIANSASYPLTGNGIDTYIESLKSSSIPISSINRKLSTIRHLSRFLYLGKHIDTDFMDNYQNVTSTHKSNFDKEIENFEKILRVQGLSKNTIKNYLSDLRSLYFFLDTHNLQASAVKSSDIKTFAISQKDISPNTLERKIAALKKYFDWKLEGTKTANPVDLYVKESAFSKVPKSYGAKTDSSLLKTVSGKKPVYFHLQQTILNRLGSKQRLQKLTHGLFFKRPEWYIKYHTIAITRYFHLAILVIFATALGFVFFNQLDKARLAEAFPTTLTRPNRFLSFQGRLTDELANPITTSTNFVFRLYNASSGGTTLWNSGTCAVTPDQDGIFSSLLGSSCGSEITSGVFSENAGVWLGVAVGADSEATPRIQIATVAYALNAETLQGFPAGTGTSTIPYIDASGILAISASSPKIDSTTGTFSIEGQAISVVTGAGSAGDITIAPDGAGNLFFTGGTTTEDFIRVTNANLSSGSLISGYVGNNSDTGRLLELTSGTSETDRFAVSTRGRTLINANGGGQAALIVNQIDNAPLFTASASGTARFTIANNGNIDTSNQTIDWTLNNAVDALNFDSNTLSIDAANNRIGIGTAAPSSTLEVTGDVELTNLLDNDGTNFFDYAGCTTSTTVTAIDSTGAVTCAAITGITADTVLWNDISGPDGNLILAHAGFTTDMSWDFTTTADDYWSMSFDNNGGTAGTDRLVVISNAVSTNTTGDLTTEAMLVLDQADTTASGNTAVTDGLLITNSGGSTFTNAITIGSGTQVIGTALNIASTGVTTDISLQNGETIDNNTDGTILLTSPTTSTSGNLSVAGTTGLTFTGVGGQINFTNGETIDNDTDGTVNIGTTTLLLTGGTTLSSNQTTVNVFNATTTTLNIGGAATAIELGAATGTTSINNALTVDGNTTLGNASGDTVTVNAAAWTFANDTDFTLTGGVNGLSFDGTTFSVDALNNRIGIGTAAPSSPLEVDTDTASGIAVTIDQDDIDQTALDFDINNTAGDIINVDWGGATTQTAALTGIDLDFANLTTVAGSTTYGIRITSPAVQTTSTEYAIYQSGTNWDYGIFIEGNAFFNNLVDIEGALTMGGDIDLDGNDLILDSDGDTSIGANTDDQINITISNATDFSFTANAFTAATASDIITSNLGVNFTDSDTNPGCAAGEYKIYSDTSETLLKKCQNGSVSDLDTSGGVVLWNDLNNPDGPLSLDHTTHVTTFATSTTTTDFFTVNANSLTTGTAFTISSTSTTLTSGGLFEIVASGDPGSSWTGDLAKFEITGNAATIDASALKVGVTASSTGGSASTALNVTSAGPNNGAIVARFNDDGTYTDSTPIIIDAQGQLVIGGTSATALLDVKGAGNFDLGAADFVTLDAATTDTTTTGGVLFVDMDTTASGKAIRLEIETITDSGSDTVSGLYVSATQSSTDPDNIYGLHIVDLAGTPTAGNERAIYQAGTSWDYGIYIEDAAFFENTIDVDGSSIILDVDNDTHITANIDDQIDIAIAGADDFTFTANAFTAATSSDIITSNLGINFTDSDTNPGCAAGEYKIYADLSETKLKKCMNGTATDLDTTGVGSSPWTDAGTYLYPTDGEVLGNSASAGANKIAGIYLLDSAPLVFGTDNDVSASFASAVLSVTTGNNDINFDSNTLFIDGSENFVGIGSATPGAQLQVGSASETHTLDVNDVLIAGDLELDGVFYLDGGQIANVQGTSTILLSSTPATTEHNLTSGSWLVNNTLNVGMAALMVDQTKAGEIFTASSSGVTKFTIDNSGNVGIGDSSPDALLDIQLAADQEVIIDATTADSTGTTGVFDINLDATSSQQAINIDAEVIDDNAIDTLAGISITMTNSANDSDVVYGLHVANLGGAASGGNEYAIYQAGTSWDYGLFIEDAAFFGNSIDVNGTSIILDADGDTSITADTDDQIDIALAGADDFTFTTNAFTAATASDIITSNLGVNFTDSDTNPGCAAGEYKIYADLSETKLKKCMNGTATDLDTTGGGATAWDDITNPDENKLFSFSGFSTDMTWDFTTTADDYWTMAFDNNGGTAGTDRLVVISNAVSDNTAGDLTTEAMLVLDQADTVTTGTTAVTDGLLITNSGGSTFTNAITVGSGTQAIGTALNIASTGVTTDIRLQNGETIDNDTDGTIKLTATNFQVTGMTDCEGVGTTDTGVFTCNGSYEGYDNTGGTSVTGTPATVTIDTTRKSHGDFSLASNAVSIDKTGLYNIRYNCGAEQTGTAGNNIIECYLEIDADAGGGGAYAEIDGTRCSGGARIGTTETGCSSNAIQDITTAGADVRIQIVRTSGTSTITTLADMSSITVTKLGEGAADIAEVYYTNEKDVSAGTVVSFDTEAQGPVVKKSTTAFDPTIAGVVSTDPAEILGAGKDTGVAKNAVALALTGRVPVKVNLEGGNITSGDFLTSSSTPGIAMKANGSGRVIGVALDDYTGFETDNLIDVFINLSWSGGNYELTETGEYELAIQDDIDEAYAVLNEKGEEVTQKEGFAEVVAGVIETGKLGAQTLTAKTAEIGFATADTLIAGVVEAKDMAISGSVAVADTLTSGAVVTKDVTTNTLRSFTANIDNLIIKSGLVAPTIKTDVISPLAGGGLKIDLSESTDGSLAIVGEDDTTVASIDGQGNIAANSVEVDDLKAKNIYKDGVEVADYIRNQIENSLSTNSSFEEIEALLAQAEIDQNLIEQNHTLAGNAETPQEMNLTNLYVTGTLATNSLSVSTSLTLGSDLIIQSNTFEGTTANSIDTLVSPLKIQSLALAPLEIMAGKVQIDTDGNIIVAGNLAVAGNITGSTVNIAQKDNGDGQIDSSLLSLLNSEGLEVAGVSSTGAAEFSQIGINKLVIANGDATTTQLVDGAIQTNATAGTATLPLDYLEIRIDNPNVNDNTLVYITPTSSTDNNVLFVKSKGNGFFVVGFNDKIAKSVDFNWWIIETKQ